MSQLSRIVGALLASCHTECNTIEMQMLRPGFGLASAIDGGCARIDVDRDTVISVMRRALASTHLAGCTTKIRRLQSSHILDLTMERLPLGQHSQRERHRERVFCHKLLSLSNLTSTGHAPVRDLGIPMVWLEWDRRRVPSELFPCITQRHDLRHCIRREISVGNHVLVCFETCVNETSRPIYRVWVEISIRADSDLVCLAEDVERALSGLGV